MNQFELQKLRELPIEAVAERLGLCVSRHKCLCPFHDDHHASMSFHIGRNTFRCFVCDAKGGTIDLVMKYLNKDFVEACRWLIGSPLPAPPLGECLRGSRKDGSSNEALPQRGSWRGLSFYSRFFERPFLNEEAKRFLFEERRLDERVVRWCRLTSWRDKQGVPWLQIPYYNREGKLVGVQNRNLVSSFKIQDSSYLKPGTWNLKPEAGPPRFRFPQGAECGIYNLPVLNMLKPGDELYITEGCSDCWAMLSAGHKAIAIPSATLLSQKDKEILQAIAGTKVQGVQEDKNSSLFTLHSSLGTSFHMFPDRDAPGERLFLQLQKVLPNLVHHQLPPGCKDFSDYFLTIHNS